MLTALVDFLAVQLTLYSRLAMSIELAAVRRAEKGRKIIQKIPVAAEQNNVLLTAAKAFDTAATCMSEVGPRMVDIAQAAANACSAKTEQKTSPTRSRAKTSAIPEMTQTDGKRLPGKSPSSPTHT
jgi:predicted choloylglycine hydrolase